LIHRVSAFTIALCAAVPAIADTPVGRWQCEFEGDGGRVSGDMTYTKNGRASAIIAMAGDVREGIAIDAEMSVTGTWKVDGDLFTDIAETVRLRRLLINGEDQRESELAESFRLSLLKNDSPPDIVRFPSKNKMQLISRSGVTYCTRRKGSPLGS
jgi:hypothetical protein